MDPEKYIGYLAREKDMTVIEFYKWLIEEDFLDQKWVDDSGGINELHAHEVLDILADQKDFIDDFEVDDSQELIEIFAYSANMTVIEFYQWLVKKKVIEEKLVDECGGYDRIPAEKVEKILENNPDALSEFGITMLDE